MPNQYLYLIILFVVSFCLVSFFLGFCSFLSLLRAFTRVRSHCLENRDKAALLIHFKSKRSNFIDFNTKIYECYEVIFLQEPPVDKLDYFESTWVSNLDAKINIAKTSLPKIK